MSKIQFIKSPFPDNHNGFDYAPASFMDVQRAEQFSEESQQSYMLQNKLISMFASIFK